MAVARVQITRRTRAELGQAGINQLCRNLFAIDCQTCGKPLDAPRPAVTVDDYGTFAHAMLHHPDCQQPYWIPRDTVVEDPDKEPALSFRAFHVMQVTRDEDGRTQRMPTVLLNPSLEAAILDRLPDGGWCIDMPRRWAELGFARTGGESTELPVIPDATAALTTAADGSNPGVTITLHESLQWSLSLVHAAANAVSERGGVALLLMSDVNPSQFTVDTLDEDVFSQLLTSGTCAAGWIPLMHTRHSPSRTPAHVPAPDLDALPSEHSAAPTPRAATPPGAC